MVLVALLTEHTRLLSWRVGEGAVPGFLDTAVASMRFSESAAFEASPAVRRCRPEGPSYEGRTPLRLLERRELLPVVQGLCEEGAEEPGGT